LNIKSESQGRRVERRSPVGAAGGGVGSARLIGPVGGAVPQESARSETRVQSGDVNELGAAVYVVARLAVEASPHRGVASQACEIDPAGETLIAALRRKLRDREDSEEGNEEETDAHECSLYCWISIGYIA